MVRIHRNGQLQLLLLDDYFPCFPKGGAIYSKAHGNELWVLILEKAYAKLCGSYEALRLGREIDALVDLTGCPYKSYRLRNTADAAALWAELKELDGCFGVVMTATTPGSSAAE